MLIQTGIFSRKLESKHSKFQHTLAFAKRNPNSLPLFLLLAAHLHRSRRKSVFTGDINFAINCLLERVRWLPISICHNKVRALVTVWNNLCKSKEQNEMWCFMSYSKMISNMIESLYLLEYN